MSTRDWSFRNGIVFILMGGVVLFAAIFFGIRTGLAVKGGEFSELTPNDLMNRTRLATGDDLPDLSIRNIDGSLTTLREACGDRPTVAAFVMPGCGPCGDLLSTWEASQVYAPENGFSIILIVAVADDNIDLGEIAGFDDRYRVYTCDHVQLDNQIGIGTFPTLIGISERAAISFVSNGFSNKLNGAFFSKYL